MRNKLLIATAVSTLLAGICVASAQEGTAFPEPRNRTRRGISPPARAVKSP